MDFSDLEYNDRVGGGVGKQAEDIFEQHLADLGLVKQMDWLKTATSPWEHSIDFFWYYTDINKAQFIRNHDIRFQTYRLDTWEMQPKIPVVTAWLVAIKDQKRLPGILSI